MTEKRTSATSEVFGGSARVFVAEAISLPTGLLTAAYLARHFGPEGYGIFTLTMAIVAWLEWTLASLFGRAAVKLIADAEDWRSPGAVVLRMYGVSGLLGFAALWLAAGPLATLMHEPTLAHYLRLIAFDVPLFMLTQAHQQILVGTGQYARRATVAAWRWTGRLVLILILVGAGLSIDGAILGVVGASVLELIAARYFVKPGLTGASMAHAKTMWTFALPLFVAAISLRLFDKLDLFVLKTLGGSATLAGLYGAAQNLTIIPSLVALSLTTLLVSTLSRALRSGDQYGARALAMNALRGVVLLFPFAGVVAGTATGIATFVYGGAFAATGPLLAILLFGALIVLVISVSSAILVAAGHATWAMYVALPVAPLALVTLLLVIPRYGATGAAAATVAVSIVGAALALGAVHRAWATTPPLATVARSAIVTLVAAVVGLWWKTTGVLVFVELTVLTVFVVGALILLGELTPSERAALPWPGPVRPRQR